MARSRSTHTAAIPSPRRARASRRAPRSLHVVDMDLAFSGEARNAGVLRSIAALGARVQAAGAIVDDGEIAAALDAGSERVVLGSAALDDLAEAGRLIERYGERLVVGIEVDGDRIRARGRRSHRPPAPRDAGGGPRLGRRAMSDHRRRARVVPDRSRRARARARRRARAAGDRRGRDRLDRRPRRRCGTRAPRPRSWVARRSRAGSTWRRRSRPFALAADRVPGH